MEFLSFWLGTSILSLGMNIANSLRLFKDVADAGYKINLEKIKELGKQLNPNSTKITFISMLIPIYNLMQVFEAMIQYNNAR